MVLGCGQGLQINLLQKSINMYGVTKAPIGSSGNHSVELLYVGGLVGRGLNELYTALFCVV